VSPPLQKPLSQANTTTTTTTAAITKSDTTIEDESKITHHHNHHHQELLMLEVGATVKTSWHLIEYHKIQSRIKFVNLLFIVASLRIYSLATSTTKTITGDRQELKKVIYIC
jgi:hypothetical protein